MTNPLPSAPTAPLRVAGHFGELMQGRLGSEGPVVLVSLPCPALSVEIGGTGDDTLLGPRRVRALCAALGLAVPATLPPMRALMPQGAGRGHRRLRWWRWRGGLGSRAPARLWPAPVSPPKAPAIR
ncbi:hypothetical protein [Pararhodobacter zhoushanensis]|uniref:hypothetical protein n=1 Tax=Pararhodobacter zhoushanensis TaxID=2479545 RepID=UPI0029CAB099|nr:hypothetical protein [Pararhodobacter zhoushanensis]